MSRTERTPISVEQLRSRASSGSSQATKRGPLRADHTLPTPRSANDREIEDINQRASEAVQRSHAPEPSRPLSAQLHPTYHSDLADDTHPRDHVTGSPGDTSRDSSPSRPGSVRRRRVYLIKRPHSAPVYGRISPVSGCPGEEECPLGDSARALSGGEGGEGGGGGGRGGEGGGGEGGEGGGGPNPQSETASSAEGSGEFLRKDRGGSTQGTTATLVAFFQKHVSNADDAGTNITTRTGRGSSIRDNNAYCGTDLSGRVSPVRFAENEGGDSRTHWKQGGVCVPRASSQCLSLPEDSCRGAAVKTRPQPCSESSGSAESVTGQILCEVESFSSPTKENVNIFRDSHQTVSEPSHPASSLPLTSVVVDSVTEEDTSSARSPKVSAVQTSSRHPATTDNCAKGQSSEEIATSISEATHRKDKSSHSSSRVVPDDSCLPHAAASNTQPSSQAHFLPGGTVEDQSIREQDSTPVLPEENPQDSKYDKEPPSRPVLSDRSVHLKNTDTVHTSHTASACLPQEPDQDLQQSNKRDFPVTHQPSQQLRVKPVTPRTPNTSQASTLPVRRSAGEFSSLELSRATFGSVDDLLVGLDAETTLPKKKKKRKRSFTSWFSPRKGKYFPGKETVPFIETPPQSLTQPSQSSSSKYTGFQPPEKFEDKKTGSGKETADGTFPDTQTKHSQQEDSAARASEERREKPETHQHHGDTTSTASKNGREKSETQQHLSDTTSAHTHKEDTPASDTTVSQAVTMATDSASQPSKSGSMSDSQSTSSEDSRSGTSSGKVFSLLSSKVLKGGNSAAYENTTVTFNTNVTRHEVITIKSSAQGAADKSIVLNDSGIPEDLASTFTVAAKPVMVRERTVSSSTSSSQEQSTLTTLTKHDSKSSSSLSVAAELDSQGMIKLSPRPGSDKDLELLSTASRIVQAQRSDGTRDHPADDDHELVVIREYVFAARKTSSEGGTSSRSTPSEGAEGVSSDGARVAADLAVSEGRDNPLSSSLSPLREHDSGLDSPPSLQECHLPPVKPKRGGGGRASKEIHEEELQALKVASSQESLKKMPCSTESASLSSNPVVSGKSEESGSNLAHLDISETNLKTRSDPHQTKPEDMVTKSAGDAPPSDKKKPQIAHRKPPPPTVPTRSVPADPVLPQRNDLGEDPHSDELVVAASEKQLEVSLDVKGRILEPNSAVGKGQQDSGKEQKEENETTVASSTAVLQSPVSSQPEKSAGESEAVPGAGIKQARADKTKGSDRWSRYRDSLTEEEYNKPWESDFSSIEENIRSKISSAFPSTREDEEQEQGKSQAEANSSGQAAPSPDLAHAARKQERSKSKDHGHENLAAVLDSLHKEVVTDLPGHGKGTPTATESSNVPAGSKAGAGSQQNVGATIVPATAAVALNPLHTPRKTSAQFERPLLPQPPPPPPAAKLSKEEAKPVHAEKPHKAHSEEKESPSHHRKLKDKFKKVFSHSSEDKKHAKAEQKKTTPVMKKKELASSDEDKLAKAEPKKTPPLIKGKELPSPKSDENKEPKKTSPFMKGKELPSPKADDKSNNEIKKKEAGVKSNKPGHVIKKSVDGDDAAETTNQQSVQDTDVPDHDYMLPNMSTAGPGPGKESAESEENEPLLYSSVNHEVKLPFSPKEARKMLKAEKKIAAKAQTDDSKEHSSVENESKMGSPRAPNKALNWIRKKLATKGKKAPLTKKYTISGPDELEVDEGDLSSREAKSPRASDSNSDSEDSHDSSDSSHSDSDEEGGEEKTKTPRKIPFWGGKKDKKKKKKKAAHVDSDSDSSAEESKSKLFSWSLGRKKAANSSDHEDELPASYKKTADWTPGEESSGVSGTFRKISDDMPQREDQGQAKTSMAASHQLDKVREADIKIKVTDTSTDKETSDSDSASEAMDLLKQVETRMKANTNSELSADKEAGLSAEKDSQGTSAHAKRFSFQDSDEPQRNVSDDGEYAKLRKDATGKANSDKLWKQSKSTGYVLARPVFLDDDSDDAFSSKTENRVEAQSALFEGNVAESQSEEGHTLNGRSKDNISEDTIVPAKAPRAAHQAFGALEKMSGQQLRERTPQPQLPASPVLQSKQKRVTFARPEPRPKPTPPQPPQQRNAEENPATEDEIVPRKADNAFRGLKVNRGSISKSESPVKQNGDADVSAPTMTNHPEVVLDSDVQMGSVPLPNSEPQVVLSKDHSSSIHAAVSVSDSPRSVDSDDSAGRTYLDKPGFLDVAKASWSHQDSKPATPATPATPARSPQPCPNAEAGSGEKVGVVEAPVTAVKTSVVKNAAVRNTGVETSDVKNSGMKNSGVENPGAKNSVGPSPASVFGVTLKKSGVLKDSHKDGSTGSHANNEDPEKEESDDREKSEGLGDPNPAVQTLAKALNNADNPDPPTKHPAVAKAVGHSVTDDASLMLSPSSNRRKTRAVTPSELKSARDQETAPDSHPPRPVTRTPSQADDSEESQIDWLDSGGHSAAPDIHVRYPEKPAAVAPKPKVFAKPKLYQPKGKVRSPATKLKEETLPSPQRDGPKEEILFPSEMSAVSCSVSVTHSAGEGGREATKPAVKAKPIPPSKPAKPAKATPLTKIKEAITTLSDPKSPEPKPRKLQKDNKQDSAVSKVSSAGTPLQHQTGKIVQESINAEAESTLLSTPGDQDSQKETVTDPSTSSWGETPEPSVTPCVGDFTVGLGERPEESTSRSEDSQSTLDPHVGDFTLSLATHGEGDKKEKESWSHQTGSSPDSTISDQRHGAASPTESSSDFTSVTDLGDSQTSSTFSPQSRSTPLAAAPVTSHPTSSDVTLSSISTLQQSVTSSERTSERRESDIYEPIFFEDLQDPRSSRPTEAPPVRPEKQGKRRLEPPRILHPDYDDDPDNMYDVPRTHQTFAFPKENNLPVLCIVDKRGSKTSLTGIKSLEPEDSITPYATCHRTPQFVKQESDYEDDENPYMNDEDLKDLCHSQSQREENFHDDPDDEEAVHASLKELFPNVSRTDTEKEDNPSSLKPRDGDHTDPGNAASREKPGYAKCRPKFRIGSSSSESSSHTESSLLLSSSSSSSQEAELAAAAAAAVGKKQESQTSPDKNGTQKDPPPDAKTDPVPEEEEDQYLKSPEYKHSVDEINKLYAALEKEEQEMERQSSLGAARAAGPRTYRLLSFDEQRAELKPLKPKPSDEASEHSSSEDQKTEPPPSLKPIPDQKHSDKKQTKPGGAVRKPSSSPPEPPVVSAGGSKPTSPQSSPSLQKSSRKSIQPLTAEEPEGVQAEIQPLTDKEGEGKDTPSTSKDSSPLHRLAGFFKSGIKGSPGTDRKVKVTPKEHERGSKVEEGEKDQDVAAARKEEEDVTNTEREPQDSPLVTELIHHHMYAQVHKTPAADTGKRTPNSPGQALKEDEETSSPPPMEASSPLTAKKTSTLSSFFVTKAKPHPGPNPEDKMASEAGEPETKKGGNSHPELVTKMAAMGLKTPFEGAVTRKPRGGDSSPEEEEEGGEGKSREESAPKSPLEVSVQITSSEASPDLKSSPEGSVFEAGEPPSPSSPPVKTEAATQPPKTPTEPPQKPTTPQKPDVPPKLPETSSSSKGSEPGKKKPATKPQPKPRDLTRTYSDVEAKVPATTSKADPLPEDPSPGKWDEPQKDEAPEVPARHSSLFSSPSPDALQDLSASSSKSLPQVPRQGHKNRLRVPGARSESEGSEEEEEEEEETEEEDEEEEGGGGGSDRDGDSPPLPERRYRETQSKYNEYSNVIRVDSTKLKEARLRSLSRPLLTDDPPDKKDKAVNRLRNALSLDGGLDKKSKKTKKTKKKRKSKEAEEDEEGKGGGGEGERKMKKPFLLRSFKGLFGKKKKVKEGGGEEGEGGGGEEGEGEENVYEVVDDTATETSKSKHTTPNKHTWPKQKKRKKSESGSGEHPVSTTQHPQLLAVDSSHDSKDVRPIGRLLQLNPDGTQVVELIRPPNGQLGVQLTQGNEETLQGKFVSGFVDKSTQKLLSGILHTGDQILKINDQSIDDCPLIEVHNIIDSQQRLKFLVFPSDNQ